VRPRAATVPTGSIARLCGSTACAPKHSGSQPLSLVLQLPGAFAAASVSWARADGIPIAAGDVSGLELTVPVAKLPAAGTPLVVQANISLNGESGSAMLTVPVNSAPYCPPGKEKCLTVDAKHDIFPYVEFVATASGFSDDDDGASNLMYEWGVFDQRQRPSPLLIDRVTTYKFVGLPKGQTKIYVRATDAAGASAEEWTVVTVRDPPAEFSATSAVESVNISTVASLGDPALLNQAANSIVALASFGLTSNTTSDAAKQELMAAVNDKGAALLVASAAKVDAHDPEAAQTAAFSAASMVRVMNMSSVSEEAKGAALDIGMNCECWFEGCGFGVLGAFGGMRFARGCGPRVPFGKSC